MSPDRLPDLATETGAFIVSVAQRLDAGRGVRRSVPGGWLHMDRPLPFLCVYRHRPEGAIDGAERLVLSQASHLSISDDPAVAPATRRLVAALGERLSSRFGAFLLIELWPEPGGETFRVHAPPTEPASTVAALAEALKHVDVLGAPAHTETVDDPAPAPPAAPPLLTPEEQRACGVLLIGLSVPGFFIDAGGRPFPAVLRRLQHDLGRALQQTAFEFATVQTNLRPEHFRALGPRRLLKVTREADRRLAEIAGQIDYLLAVTPVNTDDAWEEFRRSGFSHDPTFHYRPLTVDPDLLKRALYAVPLERVEDPTLAAIFRAQRQTLDRQVSLLEDRGSAAFLPTSLQLFGGVEESLYRLAESVLGTIRQRGMAPQDCPTTGEPCIDAAAFAGRARAEIARYGADLARKGVTVWLRPDVPGVLVSSGQLLVGTGVQIPRARVEALVQHEVGTHIVTAVNGRAQPLRLLSTGLAGYEETQEGLAVLAEFVVGGLTVDRLVTLAARVVAVGRLLDGATFTETFRDLHDGHGLTAAQAFRVTMRVYRSGGLTKDAIYLRGLDRMLRHLAGGHPLDPLLVGKVPLDFVPLVQELQWRGVLRRPRLQPRWLDPQAARGSQERLAAVRAGLGILDLIPEERR
ncbi:MAG: tyrosine/phenylalanine carboxypeptidase domain-containing protein [Actinomycetota bacterium]|jgi:uncharacterized protein (TIGR02421 family)